MLTLYGIPNCDTVKKARRWLESTQRPYQFHDFRADGLSPEKVRGWLDELGADTLINRRSTTWRQLDESQKLALEGEHPERVLADHPALIRRPVLEAGKGARCGFKAEDWSAWLG